MTMTVEETSIIEFRKKFERFVNEENRAAITEAFVSFCNKPEDFARNCLWSLTYQGESIEETMEDLLEVFKEQFEGNVPGLRNELRYQYQQQHPKFLDVSISEECEEAFIRLRNISDEIVAYRVHMKCQESLYAGKDMERSLFLLNSEKENHFFGGIRSLGFDKEEAEYLKPYHAEIHELLQVMYEAKNEEEKVFENRPFEGLDQILEEAGVQLAEPVEERKDYEDLPFFMEEQDDQETAILEEAQEEVHSEEIAIADSVVPNREFKPLTPENIMEDLGALAGFVKSDVCRLMLAELRRLGYDLNELQEKTVKIETLIDAIGDLYK